MGALINELHFYEIILIVLGIFLFILLIKELSNRFSKEKPLKKFMPFFALPVLMIGFPSIQNFEMVTSYWTIKLELRRDLKGTGNPTKLLKAANAFSQADINDSRNLILLAEAFRVGGNIDQAKKIANEAADKQPSNDDVGRLQSRISIQENINRLRTNPQDVLAKQEIQNELLKLEHTSELGTTDLVTLARGNRAIGNMQRAKRYSDSVQRENSRIIRQLDY